MTESMFCYKLGQEVSLSETQENGSVIGRAHYLSQEPHYLIRYAAADGRQVEVWWAETAITEYHRPETD